MVIFFLFSPPLSCMYTWRYMSYTIKYRWVWIELVRGNTQLRRLNLPKQHARLEIVGFWKVSIPNIPASYMIKMGKLLDSYFPHFPLTSLLFHANLMINTSKNTSFYQTQTQKQVIIYTYNCICLLAIFELLPWVSRELEK